MTITTQLTPLCLIQIKNDIIQIFLIMIKQSIIQQNANFYIQKMEEKMIQDQKKIKQLQDKIDKSARMIQKNYRKYIFYKKTLAARKIQKFWKKILKKIIERKQKLLKFKQFFSSYKIFYFLKAAQRRKFKPLKLQYQIVKAKNKTTIKLGNLISSNIKSRLSKYMILISALQSEMAYLKKYAVYDRKTFTQQWQSHQKKQRQWMWAQIKKKWVKKQGNIWINDSQKQINAQKYVNTIIQQAYEKEYERHQQSQRRINQEIIKVKDKIQGIKYSYYLSLLK